MNWPRAVVGLGLGFLAALMPRAHAAPDNTRGMALMGAYIGSDGAFRSGSGVIANYKLATGDYQVLFDRNISECIVSATPVSLGDRRSATVYVPPGNPASVEVVTWDSAGAVSDTPFYLFVFCSK